MMYRYDLHVHTVECDPTASVPAAEIVRLYHDAGYNGLVITDHCFSTFYDWFADELAGKSPSEIIDRWLRGYYEAKNEGEKYGMTILPGAEVRFDGMNNDYLLYGVTEEFIRATPQLLRLKGLRELFEILPKDVCVVQAHPFRMNLVLTDPAPMFGIEVYNGSNDAFRNHLAKELAVHYQKPMTSGSDFHHREALARGGIMTQTKIQTPADLVSVLKSGKYALIETL
ncbi:MAG: transposase [Clostridia bacterium]|nr:transposase [Clostridia bacterium]